MVVDRGPNLVASCLTRCLLHNSRHIEGNAMTPRTNPHPKRKRVTVAESLAFRREMMQYRGRYPGNKSHQYLPAIERYNRRVIRRGDDECWGWNGTIVQGYAKFKIKQRVVPVHVFSFLYHGGKLSKKNPWVLHTCDNRQCTNPKHLYAGNINKNSRDVILRGRAYKIPSATHHARKLTWAIVKKIRKNNVGGNPDYRKEVAAMYGVGVTTIEKVINRKTWRNEP